VFLYSLPNSCIALLFGITGAARVSGRRSLKVLFHLAARWRSVVKGSP
jgi:hypothetical protein